VKLFGAQRRRETAKPLQFLELMKARKDDFLKLMIQSSRFFQESRKTELLVSYDLLREEAIKKTRSLNVPRSHFKAS
jgi:hypothetical protein